jgi:hypothetical protein
MTHQYTNTLPPEVLQQLRSKAPSEGWHRDAWIAEQSAKWGADQELKECLDWLEDPCCADMPSLARDLKYSRRPGP